MKKDGPPLTSLRKPSNTLSRLMVVRGWPSYVSGGTLHGDSGAQ